MIKTYKPSIQNLDNIPLTSLTHEYLSLIDRNGLGSGLAPLIEDFSSKYNLKHNADWFWGQAFARIAAVPLPLGSDGLYSAKTWYTNYIKNDTVLYAIAILAKYPTRSAIVHKQTEVKYRNYCSLVPLLMAAYKQLQNIPYSAWNKSEVFGIVEPNLYSAMTCTVPDMGISEILEAREYGLTPKTGKSAGVARNPAHSYGLWLPKDNPLYDLPTLAKMMVCQTWCAHPVNRTNLMILDPSNWDNMPEPLITTTDLFKEDDQSWAL